MSKYIYKNKRTESESTRTRKEKDNMKSGERRCEGEHCSSRLQGVTRRAARLGEPCAGNPPVLELLGNSRDKEQAELGASPTPTTTAASPRALVRCNLTR